MSDYKEEIERHGGKVVAAIFYGKTFSMPQMSVVRMSVWGDSISHAIKGRKSHSSATQSHVGVSGIDHFDVRTLFVQLAHDRVHAELMWEYLSY